MKSKFLEITTSIFMDKMREDLDLFLPDVAEMSRKPEPDTVILAWASRKRHIFVNGVLLCEKQHKSAGYSPKGGHYVSYQLEMPNKPKSDPDTKHTHTDGIIPALPLDEIKIGDGGILRDSICAACQKRYDKIFTK